MNIKNIIKTVTDFLNLTTNTDKEALNNGTKRYLIESVERFLFRNREKVYGNISEDIRYDEFCKIAKKKWNVLLKNVFTKKVMKNEDVNVHQMIVSDIFNHFHKDIIREIRCHSYDIGKGILTSKRLNEFSKNVDLFYEFLTMKERKGIKLIYNVDKYGKDFINGELKSVVNRLIDEKNRRMRYYKNYYV